MNRPSTEFSAETGHPQRNLILAIMCTCLILVVAGVSSLNIAIPSIIEDLRPTSTEVLWIVDGYALVFAGLLLPAGALGDRYGRKGALLLGLAIFAAAAVWAAYSTSATSLIVARGTMGVGAAFIMPATLSILIAVFPVEERGKAIAVWSGFAGAGGAIGIIAGGALLERYWWGAVFFINVPIAVFAAVLIARVVPRSRGEGDTRLDPVGAVLSIAGLGALVYAIIEGGEIGWGESTTIGWFVAAAVFLVAWLAWESRIEHPMLDPAFFKRVPFSMGSLTIMASFAVMFGMFFIITQFFQFAQGLSPLQAGLRNLPFAITMVIIAPRSPALAARVGKRGAIVAGLLVQVVGFAVLASMDVDTPYAITAIGLVLTAGGMALLMPAASESIVSSVAPGKAGVASAWNDTTREVGGALGIAVLGTVLARGYRSGIEDATAGLPPEAAEIANDGIGGTIRVAERSGLPDLLDAAGDAFVDGMSRAYWLASAIGVVAAIIVALRYPSRSAEPPPVEDPVDGPVETSG